MLPAARPTRPLGTVALSLAATISVISAAILAGGAAASTHAGGPTVPDSDPAASSSTGTPVLVARLAAGTLTRDLPDQDAVLATLEADLGDVGLERRRTIVPLDAVTYSVSGDIDEAARRLAEADTVVDVERDTAVGAHQRIPDDTRWNDQWGLQQANAPAAWTTTTGSEDVTIAILDTGVQADHPDLVGNVTGDVIDDLTSVIVEDAIDNGANLSGDGAPTDTSDHHGHGTASAGVANADTDNVEGIAGACWRCRILPVKVLGDDGGGAASDVAAGIVYAVDAGADVLSLSLGASNATNLLRDAVTYATARDALVVASAGNYGNDDEVYPAAFDDAVGVVASDRDDARYNFSSFGAWAEIAAPGCNPATDLDNGYKRYCGTSSAAPLVAGVAGLARSADGSARVEQVRAALAAGAVEFDGAEWGRVDAAATLAAMSDTEPPDVGDPVDDVLDDPDEELDHRTDLDDPREEHDGDPGVRPHRVAGPDRFATAARLSREAFDGGGGLLDRLVGRSAPARVYLTSGLTFADALAAGPVAGIEGAPVLLTAPGTLPQSTADELARLDPDEVVVVGGPSAVSSDTAAAAGHAGDADTTRVAGGDRFATAAQLATEAFGDGADVAYVATGLDYADALAGVPAAVADDAPMLLTAPDVLPEAVDDALAELDPERVVVLGGTGAVREPVAAALGRHVVGDVDRLAGSTRFSTAAAVADQRFDTADTVYLATGADFPDALAAGPVAGRTGGPLLLVTRDELPTPTTGQLRRLRPETNVTMGGTAVISESVQTGASSASVERRDGS